MALQSHSLRQNSNVCNLCISWNTTRYEESSRYRKMRYEEEFLRYLQNIMADVDRRIRRGHTRLNLSRAQEEKVCFSSWMITDTTHALLKWFLILKTAIRQGVHVCVHVWQGLLMPMYIGWYSKEGCTLPVSVCMCTCVVCQGESDNCFITFFVLRSWQVVSQTVTKSKCLQKRLIPC